MTPDEQAREAAVNALRQDHMGAIYPTRKSGLKEIANAAIDAYIAKLREGMRKELRDALEHVEGALPFQDAINPEAVHVLVAALSAQRQDHTELIAQIRSEANIADRPGQFDRLNAIADALEGKSDE